MAPVSTLRSEGRAVDDPDRSTVAGEPSGRPWWPVLVGAVGLVVGLSVWGLGRSSLWLDEAISLGATNQLRDTLRNTAGTMGLYYVLLDGWTAVVGTSVAALRSLSVVAVAGTVVVAGLLARRLLRRDEALVAIVLLGTSTGLVRYAQEARSYALVALLTAGAWAVATRAVAAHLRGDLTGARPWWRALAVISVAGVTAHGMYPLQVAAIATALALLPDRRTLLRALVPTCVATAATVGVLAMVGATEVASWVPPLRASQLGDLALELLGSQPLAAVVLGGLAVLGGLSLLQRSTEDAFQRWCHLAPVAWGVIPPLALILLSIVRPYLVPRYVVASVPGLLFLVAVGAVEAVRLLGGGAGTSRRRRRAAGWGVGAVLAVSVAAGQLAVHQRPGDDWDRAAELVSDGARPGDAVLFPTAPLRIPFEAAWRGVDGAAAPTPVGQPRALGEVRRFDEPPTGAAVEEALAGASRIWVIHKTTFGGGDAALDDVLDLAVDDGYRVVYQGRAEGDIDVLLLARA